MNEHKTKFDTLLNVRELGRQPYRPVLDLQKQLHRKRNEGTISDTLLFVEHDPVYTLGKVADRNNIITSEQQLRDRGIDVVEIERGGDVTYHGPGQIVGYPILDLRGHKRSVSWYMRSLEETILRTLDTFGIQAGRDDEHPGVWIGNEKICAVGVRIARWTTYHGFALNVDPDRSHFDHIVPCGIRDRGITTMTQQMEKSPDVAKVKEELIGAFQEVFGFKEVRRSSGEELE